MRSAAYSHAKMAKVSRYKCTGIEILYAETKSKSKPACLHRHGSREKSDILNLNSPTFLTLSQELAEPNILMRKSWGHRPF